MSQSHAPRVMLVQTTADGESTTYREDRQSIGVNDSSVDILRMT